MHGQYTVVTTDRSDPQVFHLVLPLASHLLPSVLVQLFLADPDFLGSYFEQFVIPDVANGLFNRHGTGRHEFNLFVVGVGPHVCHLLLLCRVHFQILLLVVLPDHQTVVDRRAWTHKQTAELLELLQNVRSRCPLAHTYYRPLRIPTQRTLVRLIFVETRLDQSSPLSFVHQLSSDADQGSSGADELELHFLVD